MAKKGQLEKFLMTPEGRKRFEEALKKREEETKPLYDAIRDSERITAEDLAITINARDTDRVPSPAPQRKR